MAGEIRRTSSQTLGEWAQERITTADELNSRELQVAAADIGSKAVNEWIAAHPVMTRKPVPDNLKGQTSSGQELDAWAQDRITTADELNSRELQVAAADIGSKAVNEWIAAHPVKTRKPVPPVRKAAPAGTNPWATAKTSEVVVAQDGTRYFGSNQDGFLKALNPDGTLKWQVLTGGILHSKPQVEENGVVSVKVVLPFGPDKLIRIHPDGYTLSRASEPS